ncbi:MAG TPA: hypothetical protein VKK79_12625 [Candidatus Lokiarchaeia archaeon]|nr:hypothetical protein [Candidatus Lokiarchaeia archaeon]
MSHWKSQAFVAGAILFAMFATPAAASTNYISPAIHPGGVLTYNVLSGSTFSYYDQHYNYLGDVKLEAGGHVQVTINGTYDLGMDTEACLNINVTDHLGATNITVWNDTDSSVGSNFALGLWPNNLGFVPNTNWVAWNASLFASLGASQLTTFTNIGGIVTIIINATSGHQNTTLIYDANTGILKYSFTQSDFSGANPYILQLATYSISLPGEVLTYNVLSGSTFSYYDQYYNYLGDVKLEAGGHVQVTINGTYTVGADTEAWLDVNVTDHTGATNFTVWNDTDSSVGSNFALGLWPNNLGFAPNTNWAAWNASLFASLGASQLTTFTNVGGIVTIIINATSGNQNTTLIYDNTTGVLQYAFTQSDFSGPSPYILELATVTHPAPPLAPVLTPITNPVQTPDGSFTLNWVAAQGAIYYAVYEFHAYITSVNTSLTVVGYTMQTSLATAGWGNGTYFFGVVATNLGGSSPVSNNQSAVFQISPPAAPILSPITPNPSTTGSISLNWPQVPGALSYEVYEYSSNITTLNASVTILGTTAQGSFTVNDLGNGTYYFAVTASNRGGNSSIYGISCQNVTVSIPAWTPPPAFASHPPDAQIGFTIVAGANQILIAPTSIGVNITMNVTTSGPVRLVTSAWKTNPASSSPSFDNNSAAVYFAIDANDTTKITFPILITITLPADLPAGASAATIKSLLQLVTWNASTSTWDPVSFDISVNATARTATIALGHLSTFALGVVTPKNAIPGYIIALLGMAIVAGIAVILLRPRKSRVSQKRPD